MPHPPRPGSALTLGEPGQRMRASTAPSQRHANRDGRHHRLPTQSPSGSSSSVSSARLYVVGAPPSSRTAYLASSPSQRSSEAGEPERGAQPLSAVLFSSTIDRVAEAAATSDPSRVPGWSHMCLRISNLSQKGGSRPLLSTRRGTSRARLRSQPQPASTRLADGGIRVGSRAHLTQKLEIGHG